MRENLCYGVNGTKRVKTIPDQIGWSYILGPTSGHAAIPFLEVLSAGHSPGAQLQLRVAK